MRDHGCARTLAGCHWPDCRGPGGSALRRTAFATLYADRLEGQAAAAHNNVALSLEMLTRSADGFAALEAIWEEARSRLMLAELVSQDDHQQAKTQIGLALPVFERLGSVAEMQRTRALLERLDRYRVPPSAQKDSGQICQAQVRGRGHLGGDRRMATEPCSRPHGPPR
jgi:hypothetical protein